MMALFNAYKEANRITDAVLVGRNLFNRNPANREIFAGYFDLLCSLAEKLPMLSERQNFAGQAEVALAFFSENAELDAKVVEDIRAYEQRINDIKDSIDREQSIQKKKQFDEIVSHNNDCLKTVYAVKSSLRDAPTQEAFEEKLAELGEIDSQINKDLLTEDQFKLYNKLTKECTDEISKKMRDFEHKDSVAYNKKAVEAYKKAFKSFKDNESKYKNQAQLYGLAAETLFAFDAAKLFNETLIYYNHVYSYIFSKLDDDGKLALTRFSIECERKLR